MAVADTGHGIAPELIDRVFVPFDRLDAEARGVEGTGIGLSFSKTFVEAMGGTIGVESSVGQGSTFWVELPAAPGPDVAAHRLAGSDGAQDVEFGCPSGRPSGRQQAESGRQDEEQDQARDRYDGLGDAL